MTKNLVTYLNNHLAGSEVALEMLGHMTKEHEPIAAFASELKAEIEADRGSLEAIMKHLEISQSTVKQAAAWVSEKASRVKLSLDDHSDGEFRLMEMLEALSLGIEGKLSLWKALEAASDVNLLLRPTDFAVLKSRAEDQRGRVEKLRLESAKRALGPPPIAEKG